MKIVQGESGEKGSKTSVKRGKKKKNAAFSAFLLEKQGAAWYIGCSKNYSNTHLF